jgi:hypothetical protein
MLNTVAEGLVVATCVWLAPALVQAAEFGDKVSQYGFQPCGNRRAAIFVADKFRNGRGVFLLANGVTEFMGDLLDDRLAAVASILLARLSVSLLHIAKLRRSSTVVDPSTLDPTLRTVCMETSRRVELRASEKVRVPAALGFFRPAVIVPRWTLEELPAEELRVILLHELAHLHRWDDWTNLAQKIVKALFFFHPGSVVDRWQADIGTRDGLR